MEVTAIFLWHSGSCRSHNVIQGGGVKWGEVGAVLGTSLEGALYSVVCSWHLRWYLMLHTLEHPHMVAGMAAVFLLLARPWLQCG